MAETTDPEPLIVAAAYRSRGVGRALIAHAVREATESGIRFLSVRPVARNAEAISFFVENGFDIVGHVDLFQDLKPELGSNWKPGIVLHGKRLRH